MRFIEILDLNDRQVNSFPPKDMFPVIPMDEEMRNINFITTEGKERSFGELIDNGIIPSEARAEKGILYYHELFSINKVFETEILLTTHGIVTRNPREEGRYMLMPYGSFTGVECLGYGNPPQPLIHLVGKNESLDLSTQYIAGHLAVKSAEVECLYFILSHFYAGFKENQSTIELDTSKIIFLKSSNNEIDNKEQTVEITDNKDFPGNDNLDGMIEEFLDFSNEVTMNMLAEGYTGKGSFTAPDGTNYVGGFNEGKYDSQGTLTFTDGENYNGEWKDGNIHGKGTYTFATGDKYIGEFRVGVKNGKGTYTYGKGEFEGDVYVGDFKDDNRNGEGTLTLGKGEWEGDEYEGEWKDGKRHGKGKYTYSDGKYFNGVWQDGVLIGDRVDLNEKDLNIKQTTEIIENKKEETSIEKIIREWNSEGMIEIEKKDFIHHLSIIYPELKENTIKTMVTTMIVNKRTRTYYHGCKKPRKCSEENNYDFLYVNDDNYLTRYEEGKHGIWEIFKRQDGKLDVKLVS